MSYFLIYNHERSTPSMPVWWKSNCRGYAWHTDQAGRYTIKETFDIQNESRGDDAGIPEEIAVMLIASEEGRRQLAKLAETVSDGTKAILARDAELATLRARVPVLEAENAALKDRQQNEYSALIAQRDNAITILMGILDLPPEDVPLSVAVSLVEGHVESLKADSDRLQAEVSRLHAELERYADDRSFVTETDARDLIPINGEGRND